MLKKPSPDSYLMVLGGDTRGKVIEVCIAKCLENLQNAASCSNGAEYASLFYFSAEISQI